MKNYTVDEIEAKVRSLWAIVKNSGYGEPHTLEVTKGHDAVRITLSAMYEAPGLTLDQMLALAEFFETKNINDDDRNYEGGCESCDYGSVASFTLTIRPERE